MRARLADGVEHAAAGAAHLGVVGADLHLHFFDRLDVRDDDGAVAQVGDRDALERVVVAAARAAASDSSDELVWSCCRTNCGSPDGMTLGTVTAKRNALRPAVGSVSSVALSIIVPTDAFDVSMRGACAGDRDRFLQLADFEREVEREKLLRADADARLARAS